MVVEIGAPLKIQRPQRVGASVNRTAVNLEPMQPSAPPPVRRQFERKPVKAHAFIHCRGSFQRAKVVDYSLGGLQLEGTFGLVKRDTIQVEFISGIRLAGQVAWSLGTHTGVAFPAPLALEHPAIVDLSRRANIKRTHLSVVREPG
jgi:hypothetical protein